MVTRRWFYLIPAEGGEARESFWCHKIEAGHRASLPAPSTGTPAGLGTLFVPMFSKAFLAKHRDPIAHAVLTEK